MERLPSWLLTQTATYAGRLVGGAFAAAGARGHHYRVLHSLHVEGPTTQAGLARRTGIHAPDMVRLLNELGDSGYIMRTQDPGDKRRYLVSITPKGRKRAEELGKTAEAVQDELLEPLSPAEREQLTRLLIKLDEHHRRGIEG